MLMSASLSFGCRGESEPLRPPPTELARSSLASALDAWKAGRPAGGKLIGSNPGVGVVDTLQAERPLVDYEIVGALFALPEARPFAVRLTLDSPREILSARYVVLGRDPIWVFRQEDYELILHWEHKMSPEEAEGVAPQSQAPGPEAHR
ncbi:MAG: hypothetical protein ABS79_07610 [Planctomycetes bacterium SCN 63-9]|nr:MAG: hypothetical protein ABS79_07610 [Planctomycetes bacterium SCN 63-9]